MFKITITLELKPLHINYKILFTAIGVISGLITIGQFVIDLIK